jgi:hypothetical protein
VSADLIERRVLGALRFVDAPTGLTVTRPLRLAAPGARFLRNRLGLYVIMDAPGLGAHTRAFAKPPATPALASLSLSVEARDPSGRYLSRLARLQLPRDPEPAAAAAQSLFAPLEVALFPAPAAPASPGWAIIRASVRGPDGAGLSSALLRVLSGDAGPLLASGLSDARGEALVMAPGLQLFAPGTGDGPVLANTVSVTLRVFHDPLGGTLVDPDQLAGRLDELNSSDPVKLSLASGRSVAVSVVVS